MFKYDENIGTVTIVDASLCIFCKECTYLCEEYRKHPEDNLAVEVKHSTNKFTFTVETNGSLSAKDVVKSALQELQEKIQTLQRATSALRRPIF